MLAEWSAAVAHESAIGSLVVLISLLLPLALSLWRRRVQLALAAGVERARRGEPLVEGDATVYGKLEERDADAVRVDVHSRVTEVEDGLVYSEIGRRAHAQPFYLVRPSGERVRVEPRGQIELADAPDPETRTPEDHVVTTRRLAAGEAIFVTGRLGWGDDPRAGGYREAGRALVLGPPTSGRMRISTIPDPHAARARRHRAWIIALLILLPLFELPYLTYFVLALSGQVVQARVANVYEREYTDDDGHSSWTTNVDALSTSGEPLHDELHGGIDRDVKIGDNVPFIVASFDRSWHHLGDRAYADVFWPMLVLLLVLPLWLIYWRTLRRRPPRNTSDAVLLVDE
jgi:hypothetical protein